MSDFFCLTVPKNFLGQPFVLCSRKFPVAKKFMDKRGCCQDFPSKKFVSQFREFSYGNPSLQSFRITPVAIKLNDKRVRGRRIKILLRNISKSKCRIISQGTLLCCASEFSCGENVHG